MRAATCLGYLLGAVSAGGAALYMVVYLYRGEWQRALMCGGLLLVLEVLLVGSVLLSRMGRLRQEVTDADARTEAVLRRLEQSRGPDPAGHRFRWLDGGGNGSGGRTFVFVPVLMAAGAALAGVALLGQKLAAATARPGAERRLAGRLARLTAPPGGVRGNGPASLGDIPPVPPARPRRAVAVAVLVAAGAVGAWLVVDALSDATQTRPSAAPDAAASAIVFRVELRDGGDDGGGGGGVEQAARALWEECRRSTSVPLDHAPLTALEAGVFAGVARPALSAHDLHRLRGCLSDARADRVRAEVLGAGQAGTDG
ncbi:hypothetical protein [Streptomyces specialis]|uniref:hypothetical protein n=1 Tax=Streptomyces specialis TaxID=498367 RepID=UPI00073EA735|nr:hypothetical protein [Streptomyces specialis]